ncbi:hypothetical protein [Jannaschia formosa]|uniref:hypothetical protein n=1 Tax=Jannaschia formosa TaxID=2259592 RepID=UPI000E1C0963|nr:hypothetical protein [Jannaschia formosa]TFL19795.1 hypothetical protein DR046_00120 [Jannaschia formosa]
MTSDSTPAPRRPAPVLAGLAAAAMLAGGAALWLSRPAEAPALPAPGLAAPVDADGLRGEGYGVTVAILTAVYDAFAETEEGAIYDGLASVAAGDALEQLYLERAGALATGGLPDQQVHELELTGGTWRMADGAMAADIRWAVLGEVGHAEHTHMRGNAYAAELTVAPAGGAWRLTGFRLTEVDRSEAGTLTTLAEDGADPGAPPE